ncbi:GNAT family N-acetyltransferase [Acinetobacter baumannii]|nr:GNAT family N-acetyltransferase [Acinetobacter baumannii]MDC5272811.1 GNAT family N-acetyltransferase [Acinetobacter baumannii]MDC5366841.1 GNAT family N-acetyltransferase [Acinetobacter baumannii]MDC5563728.1 GNAT family N-acetyltransferase [Acinetobacter baumannii]MDC5616769.1 GNAT family N-acetyltransferase [Acinetobacter baumannii]
MTLYYQLVDKSDYTSAVEFALYTRELLFPEIYHGQVPKDLQNFEQHYIHDPLGCFITVKDQNRIIGTIAYRAYDHRFDLNLPSNTVEVVKLFVLPEYRRKGIATQLCEMLFSHAKNSEITTLYLHTHPFLPAAEEFWTLQGFEVIQREWIDTYDTIHMSKFL